MFYTDCSVIENQFILRIFYIFGSACYFFYWFLSVVTREKGREILVFCVCGTDGCIW